MKMFNFNKGVLLLLLLLFNVPSYSWDSVVAGKVARLDVANGGNYSYRVRLLGEDGNVSPALCSSGDLWMYLDEQAANYKIYIASLLLAKAQGAVVTLHGNLDASNHCRIGYIKVE